MIVPPWLGFRFAMEMADKEGYCYICDAKRGRPCMSLSGLNEGRGHCADTFFINQPHPTAGTEDTA